MLICPSGCLSTVLSIPLRKNISVHLSVQIISITSRHPVPQEGRIAIVTNAGRDAVDAAASCVRGDRRAGSSESVSDQQHADERCLLRTAKSCGPDAPTLASSSRMLCRPYRVRTQRKSADDGGKRARSPGRARRKPLKPLRAGMPGDSGVLVVTRVRFTTTKCTRGRGCSGHPAFPTPSLGREINAKPRAPRAARTKSYAELHQRHCEERSDEAIHSFFTPQDGLLRGACHRARIRATRWLAMTAPEPSFAV